MQILKSREKIQIFHKFVSTLAKNSKNSNFSQQKFKNFQNFFKNSFFHLLAVGGGGIVLLAYLNFKRFLSF